MTSLATLPGFITHFLAGLVLLGGAVFVHVRVTPHDEVGLIRAGNAAAAVALGGTILGFALPLASAIAHSANLLDAAVWGSSRCSPSSAPGSRWRVSSARRAPRRWMRTGRWRGR
jgi:putative membrane protein